MPWTAANPGIEVATEAAPRLDRKDLRDRQDGSRLLMQRLLKSSVKEFEMPMRGSD
jgi:hypothetical protein